MRSDQISMSTSMPCSGGLESEFLVMPKGDGFVEFSVFEAGYEALKRATGSFREVTSETVAPVVFETPIALIVLRCMLEAKLTEDDGTARDKVTRVQHLGTLSMAGRPADQPRFEVVVCIAGRGFGERREDMKKLLLATRGKVFTPQNLHQLVEHTRLEGFRSR